ncbi:astroprincin family protein [Arcicella rigui]|uniref:FAM171 N-terminal domain-containing protein n=1 Tax=Arcicella rigui TaxID=797020 RepID=A0ABU5QBX8_9BACT|nr:astroprincin family protein [Arcicella rigui]MEA5140082.1 hypothetical protein [Arcicella rigui]
MKTKLISIFRPILFLVLGLSLVLACQKINPLDDVDLTVNTDIYQAPILINFLDANVNATILPENISVSISGPGKNLIFDDLGGKNYTVAGNVLSLVLDKDAKPTETNPIKFTVSVTAPGFVSTSQTITISDPTQTLEFTVPLTKVAATPEGTAAKKETLSLTTGQTLTVPATTNKAEVATVTIAPGTQVKDESGNVIPSNTVNTQIVQYGTGSEESLNSFPGSFTPENVTLQSGVSTPGTFVSAGFVAIDMDAGGKKVKSFTKPIDVNVGINSELVNPETDQKVKEGDKIPTWSFESSTGEWKEEGIATVVKGSDGKLTATFKASHLSYWNIDWFYYLPRCRRTFILKVTSNLLTNVVSRNYYAKVYWAPANSNNFRYVYQTYGFNAKNGDLNEYTGLFTPNGSRVQIDVYSRSNNAKIGTTGIFNPCANSQIPITITAPTPPTPILVDVDFTAKCQNKNVNIKPSAWVGLYDPSGSTYYGRYIYGYMRSGKATIVVYEGREYTFGAYYGGKYYSGKVTFNKTGSKIVTSTGTGITGTTSYNASTGRVQVVASYTTNDCK